METTFTGVIPIVESCFTESGELDRQSIERITSHAVDTGVSGLMYPGFASEFASLTTAERDAGLESVVAGAAGRVPVFANVTEQSLQRARHQAKAAVDRGASALNVLLTRDLDDNSGSVARVLAIADVVPDIPLVLQVAPKLTHVPALPVEVASIRAMVPAVRAVKVEEVPPGPFIRELRALDSTLQFLVGYAGVSLVRALESGAQGVQPGVSFTEIYVRLMSAWQDGRADLVREQHKDLLPYISHWMQDIGLIIAVEKEISWRRGLIASSRCRDSAWILDAHEMRVIDEFMNEFAMLFSKTGG